MLIADLTRPLTALDALSLTPCPPDCDTSEMGPGRFSVRDVHRIGILDVRLFNTDRHAGGSLCEDLVRGLRAGRGCAGAGSCMARLARRVLGVVRVRKRRADACSPIPHIYG